MAVRFFPVFLVCICCLQFINDSNAETSLGTCHCSNNLLLDGCVNGFCNVTESMAFGCRISQEYFSGQNITKAFYFCPRNEVDYLTNCVASENVTLFYRFLSDMDVEVCCTDADNCNTRDLLESILTTEPTITPTDPSVVPTNPRTRNSLGTCHCSGERKDGCVNGFCNVTESSAFGCRISREYLSKQDLTRAYYFCPLNDLDYLTNCRQNGSLSYTFFSDVDVEVCCTDADNCNTADLLESILTTEPTSSAVTSLSTSLGITVSVAIGFVVTLFVYYHWTLGEALVHGKAS